MTPPTVRRPFAVHACDDEIIQLALPSAGEDRAPRGRGARDRGNPGGRGDDGAGRPAERGGRIGAASARDGWPAGRDLPPRRRPEARRQPRPGPPRRRPPRRRGGAAGVDAGGAPGGAAAPRPQDADPAARSGFPRAARPAGVAQPDRAVAPGARRGRTSVAPRLAPTPHRLAGGPAVLRKEASTTGSRGHLLPTRPAAVSEDCSCSTSTLVPARQ